MSNLAINDYLSSLQKQVSASVERLKNKSVAENSQQSDEDKNNNYRHDNSLSAKAYKLLNSEVSYQILMQGMSPADFGYAAKSYDAAANINRPPTVLIDFMFANNREFDFKV